MIQKAVLLVLICMVTTGLFSQELPKDSTIYLEEIAVKGDRLHHFTTGNRVESINKKLSEDFPANDLSQLLSRHSSVFIKSYGPGTLATPSLRGTGASHTAVLWNGFNLQSPMNGMMDFSLFPAALIDDAQIQYGGAGALYGSGAVGGSIHLYNKADFDRGPSLDFTNTIGSFSSAHNILKFKISNKKFISSTRLLRGTSQNDFRFINTALPSRPEQRQNNAQLLQNSLLQENYFKINDKQVLSIWLWYQFNNRNIPPTMLKNDEFSNQKDEFYRAAAEWERTGKKIRYNIRGAYFNQELHFTDSIRKTDSRSNYHSIIVEGESKITLSDNQKVNIGINNTYNQAYSRGYQGQPSQNRFSMFSSYKLSAFKDRLNSTISIREEIIDAQATPLTPSLGAKGRILSFLYLRGSIAKTYRVPTFNDLYWTPGGNPDLVPENGWSKDIGLLIKHKKEKFSFEFSTSAFQSRIKNWIIWLPTAYYWTPKNIMEVWSRGIETNTDISFKLEKITFQAKAMTSYVLSTNEKSKSAHDNSLHKQLIYTPLYQGNVDFSVYYKNIFFNYNHSYIGYRYISSDNYEYLHPYHIGNISISTRWTIKNISFNIFGQVNNLWNETYQVMAWRAMPLRNYQTGISLKL